MSDAPAAISLDKSYVTREGREVRIYAIDGGTHTPIHGAVKSNNGEWVPWQWLPNGGNSHRGKSESDLVEVRPRHKPTVWINADADGHIDIFESRARANSDAHKERIACVRIELDFEEGQFDD